jgi:hypothetical protein
MCWCGSGLGRLRHRVGAYADQAGMIANRVADLQLAVTEIGTNLVRVRQPGAGELRNPERCRDLRRHG